MIESLIILIWVLRLFVLGAEILLIKDPVQLLRIIFAPLLVFINGAKGKT